MKIRIFSLFLVLLFSSHFAEASNQLSSLTLHEESELATACSSRKILLENERFSHPDFSGYVITIFGDNAIFDPYQDKEELCVQGPYEINSRGFAPQLIIRDIIIISVNGKAVKNEDLTTPLNSKSELLKFVEETHAEWRDSNITTGTTAIRAGLLLDPKNASWLDRLRELSEKNFNQEFDRYVYQSRAEPDVLKGIALKTRAEELSKVDIKKTFETVGAGGVNFKQSQIKKLLRLLGENKEIVTLWTTAEVPNNGNKKDLKTVHSIAFLNKATREMIRIFVIEGRP